MIFYFFLFKQVVHNVVSKDKVIYDWVIVIQYNVQQP